MTSARLTINLGLAKTGTSSLQSFFQCNNMSAVHYRGCKSGLKMGFCADAVTQFLLRHWQRPYHRLNKMAQPGQLERKFIEETGYRILTEINEPAACSPAGCTSGLAGFISSSESSCVAVTSRAVGAARSQLHRRRRHLAREYVLHTHTYFTLH